jgi:transposase
MSEIGPEGLSRLNFSKEFVFGLRLAPNNKILGGKSLSSKAPTGTNHLKITPRQTADAIGNLKSIHLSDFFRIAAFLE